MRTRLKDLAAISGFSVSTVSKALNDCHEISRETRAELKELAYNCNYIPNYNAKALKKQEKDIIMVCFPKFRLKDYSDIVEGIYEKALFYGYGIILHMVEPSFCKKFVLDINTISRIDGVITINDFKNTCSFNSNWAEGSDVLIDECLPSVTYGNDKTKKLDKDEARQLGHKICKGLIRNIRMGNRKLMDF
ncbi:LacI family DNA-binding transcriptional regulator [Flagellimonas onchidii]|uniref:LacI family DNA-binding transcriptional regulator n=1 Tax=Flagellimonas onchidii TaxID=2562684 RepID=UPI0010A66835|nr:LacI family DNA-binding transcriptional regulator [Allomuricauda onchidii]